MRDTWAEWRFEPERSLDAGDRIVVFVRVVGKASASGLPINVPTAHVVDVPDGRITLIRAYLDRSEALEAVGLPTSE
jgi:ketosteroid isomerase-like protein